jgi:hypothetical protein
MNYGMRLRRLAFMVWFSVRNIALPEKHESYKRRRAVNRTRTLGPVPHIVLALGVIVGLWHDHKARAVPVRRTDLVFSTCARFNRVSRTSGKKRRTPSSTRILSCVLDDVFVMLEFTA